MHFTVVFESHESHDLSYGLAFTPCPVWKKGDNEIIALHPERPDYEVGDLQPLLSAENVLSRLADGRKNVVIVIHQGGNGTDKYLTTLRSELEQAGFAVQQVILGRR